MQRPNPYHTKSMKLIEIVLPTNKAMNARYHQSLLALAFTCELVSTATAVRADDSTTAPAATSTAAAPVAAPAMDSTAADPDGWKFDVTLPLWAPQINGNATVCGRHQDVNVNFSELKDHLDTVLALAAEMHKS